MKAKPSDYREHLLEPEYGKEKLRGRLWHYTQLAGGCHQHYLRLHLAVDMAQDE
jgi:hypothetical protein